MKLKALFMCIILILVIFSGCNLFQNTNQGAPNPTSSPVVTISPGASERPEPSTFPQITTSPFPDNAVTPSPNGRSVNLYFADDSADKLIIETRFLDVPNDISNVNLALKVFEAQIKGSNSTSQNNPLNPDVKVLNLKIIGDLATVDFSKELLASMQGTTGETFAVKTIVNILTDIKGVKRVLIKLEGTTLETGHSIYDKPIKR